MKKTDSNKHLDYFATNATKSSWFLLWTSLILEGVIIIVMALQTFPTVKFAFYICLSLYCITLLMTIVREIFLSKWKKNIQKNNKKILLLSTIYACSMVILSAGIMITESYDLQVGFWFVITNFIILIAIPIVIYSNTIALHITILLCFLGITTVAIVDEQSSLEIHTLVYIATIYAFSAIMQVTLRRAFEFNYLFQKRAFETADIQIKVSQELIKLNEELRHDSLTDSLTDLSNRKALQNDSKIIWNDCLSNKHSLCVVMIDVDNFKQINDSFGHTVGDIVLKRIAQIINENSISNNGYAYRYGGEEFLMIFLNSTITKVEEYMKDLEKNVETTYFHEISSNKIRVSVGIYEGTPNENEDFSLYITEADRRMYREKNSKNARNKKAER